MNRYFVKTVKRFPKTVMFLMLTTVVIFYVVLAPIGAIVAVFKEFLKFLSRAANKFKNEFGGFKEEWNSMKNFVERARSE